MIKVANRMIELADRDKLPEDHEMRISAQALLEKIAGLRESSNYVGLYLRAWRCLCFYQVKQA